MTTHKSASLSDSGGIGQGANDNVSLQKQPRVGFLGPWQEAGAAARMNRSEPSEKMNNECERGRRRRQAHLSHAAALNSLKLPFETVCRRAAFTPTDSRRGSSLAVVEQPLNLTSRPTHLAAKLAQFLLLWKDSNPLQVRLIDSTKPFPPSHSVPPVLKGCFLTSQVVLHLCVKGFRAKPRVHNLLAIV